MLCETNIVYDTIYHRLFLQHQNGDSFYNECK